jgi:large subunit ribosomal protein L29
VSNAKIQEIRTQEASELEFLLKEHRKRIFELRFKAAAEEMADNKELQRRRREVARILTIQRERELGLDAARRPQGTTPPKTAAASETAEKSAAKSEAPAPKRAKPAKAAAKRHNPHKPHKASAKAGKSSAKSKKVKQAEKESDGR